MTVIGLLGTCWRPRCLQIVRRRLQSSIVESTFRPGVGDHCNRLPSCSILPLLEVNSSQNTIENAPLLLSLALIFLRFPDTVVPPPAASVDCSPKSTLLHTIQREQPKPCAALT
jgi:hypothetical protein